jgi:uncharacterized membrane protein
MSEFLTAKQEQQIIDAIAEAENKTSGEIKVHVESTCDIDPLNRAMAVFQDLNLYKTERRNAVIIYVAFESKRFAIYGDEGINQVVPKDFWNNAAAQMRSLLSQNKNAEAIIAAVQLCGENLKKFFPIQENDTNELSNDISFGK